MQKIEKPFFWVIFSIGFTSISIQIILLREFLSVLYGNELVIGIILANWMFLTGIGAVIASFKFFFIKREKFFVYFLMFLGILPLLCVFLINYLRNLLFPAGIQLNINEIFLYSFILLLPFCLISGFGFSALSKFVSEKYSQNLIGRVYAIESLGSVLGGILMSLILSFLFSNVQILLLVFLFNLTLALLLSFRWYFYIEKILILIIAASIVLLNVNFHFDRIFKGYLFPEQEIITFKDTPYGNIVVTKTGDQNNVYENSLLFFSTNDPVTNEEAVHYAMIQRDSIENVLLISGGISGILDEILKYPVKQIDYLELNPYVFKLKDKLKISEYDSRVNFIISDARFYIKRINKNYDAVLLNLPEPSTAQINRYYTVEFLNELKKILRPDAVVSYKLTSSADYLSESARKFKSTIYHTLKSKFRELLIVPGYNDFFICSDSTLSIQIPELIERRNIHTQYVNRYYIQTEILQQRGEFIKNNLEFTEIFNKDFNPISYYLQINYWLSQFEFDYKYFVILLVLLLVFLYLKMNVISYGMFAGGFAASGLEMLLIIAFQVMYGYIYQTIGIIIAIFMFGLATGAYLSNYFFKNPNLKSYSMIQICVGVISISIPLAIIFLNITDINTVGLFIIIFFLTLLVGVLVGLEFAMAAKIRKGSIVKVASEIYSIDLIGSALGAFITSVFLFPLIGLINSGLFIGSLNFMGAILTFLKSRKSF